MAYTDKIVTNIRQIVANIVQKVTIIVQKVIKIVQLHLLLPAFKPVILITAPHVDRVGFERIRAGRRARARRGLPAFKPVILITWSILTNQRARNVPQNEGHLINVPHVPHMRDR